MAVQGEPHERVIVELLSSDIYEGNIVRRSSKSIELSNVFCLATNTPYDGNMTFYRNEIASVSTVTKLSQLDKAPVATGEARTNGDTHNSTKKIIMDSDEFNRLREMTYAFIFIDRFSSQFDDAVKVLSNRESIAVVSLGSTSRGKGLSLLLMADFEQIYIFDMLCLSELKNLQYILESSCICKVVHDGPALYDCLSQKYKTKMDNVFDTQIIDGMLSREENQQDVQRNISECLTHYFNFPPSLLAAAMDDIVNEEIWTARPIQKNNKIKASQLVVYLLSVRDKLMTQILKPYTTAIQNTYLQFGKASNCGLKFET